MSAATLVQATERLTEARGWVRQLVAGLPVPLRVQVDALEVQVKHAPELVDIERGADGDMRGYFYGDPILEPAGGGGDGTGCADCLEGPAWGGADPLVVLFTRNIEPFTPAEVGKVFMHELGHFLGMDEAELVEGLGLG